MPGQKLALLSVPDAFAMDDLHSKLQEMFDESFTDPSYWRALMGSSGAPGGQMPQGGPYAPQHVGDPDLNQPDLSPDQDPEAWKQQMANAGAPGLGNYATSTPPRTPGQRGADFATGLSTALNQNVQRQAARRDDGSGVQTFINTRVENK